MKRKIISLLLCLVMALSLIPTVAFAVGEDPTKAPTTNGAYNGDVWSEGGTGTIPTDDGLTLSKTAKYVDVNTYQINLTVTTTQTTTTVTTSSDAATVLVIDTSGSMAWCTKNHRHTDDCYSKEECNETNTPDHWVSWDDYFGHHAIHRTFDDNWQPLSCRRDLDGKYYKVENNCGQGAHNHDNARGGIWCNSPGLISATNSRIAYAKAAAKDFLDNYRDTTAAPAARWVAVVSFADGAEDSSDWFNVSTESGYSSAIAAIDRLTASGATNLDAGLRAADELMSLAAVSDVDKANKNVIALTDGVPTESANHGDGRYGSSEINAETAGTATALKENVNALYTICFAASGETCYEDKNSPTVDEFLSGSIASSSDTAHTADDASELNLEFGKITNTITSGLTGDGWTVEDPMPDYISVDGTLDGYDATSKTYTWKLSNPAVSGEGDTKTYTYTTSYTVKIDPNGKDANGNPLNEKDFYPTNEVTTLRYKDANGKPQTADFPVPGVKVTRSAPTPTTGSLTISKKLEGDLVATDFKEGFSFTVWKGTEEIKTIAVWPGCPVTLTLEPGMYTIVENNAEVDDYKLTTSGTGDVTVKAGEDTPVTVTNTYEKEVTPPVETVSVEIPITKTVSAKVGSTLPKDLPNFTFKALLNGKPVGELKLSDMDSIGNNQYQGALTANIPAAAFANNNNMVTLTIKEDKGTDTRWTYDKDFYTVDVFSNGDGISCSGPMLNGKGDPLNEGISFENIYTYKYTPARRPTTPAKPVTSVQTGDMGVALYAGLAILSMTGSAGVILRRRKNDK